MRSGNKLVVTRSRPAWPFVLLGLILTFGVGVANLAVPTIRLSNPLMNEICYAAFLLLPFAIVAICLYAYRWCLILAVLFTPIMLWCGLRMVTSVSIEDPNATFRRVASIRVDGGRIVAYRTNGGAMTAFGIVVRREKSVIPGVLFVHNLWRGEPGREATFRHVSPDAVELTIDNGRKVVELEL